jgi:hypothetical protein
MTRWILSLIQCCGTNDRVQYADIGLPDVSNFPLVSKLEEIGSLALENHNKTKDQAICRHPHHEKRDKLLQLFVAGCQDSAGKQEHGDPGADACHRE